MIWVVQIYDEKGYYAAVVGTGAAEIRAKVAARCQVARSLIACSLPYAFPDRRPAPDASLPADWRPTLDPLAGDTGT
jgi:hypothetical protein